MKFNKKLAVAVSGAVLLMAGQIALADSTTDIVDALVSKGVLTEEEGKLISKGAVSKAKADEKANKSRISVGSFIDNATMYGDIRARYERRDVVASTDGKDYETNRPRYKFTFGINSQSGDWYSDIAFAASPKGTSDNVTLGSTAPGSGSGMTPKTDSAIYLKRAMLGWNATPWLAIEAGRMANPLYSVNAMVFDRDIVMEGLNEKVKFNLGATEVFGNFGQWIYGNNYTATDGNPTKQPAMMFAFQGGLKNAFIDNKASAKAAISYYQYSGNSTSTAGGFSPWLGTSGRGNAASSKVNSDGTYSGTAAVAGMITTGASVNDLAILDIPLEVNYMATESIGTRLYGEYANNLSGTDRYNAAVAYNSNVQGLGNDHDAWLIGFVVGSAKDFKSFEGNKMKAGDWNANLWYQSVGAYALDPNAVDSDIFDSRVNMEGAALKLKYNVADNVILDFTGAWGERKNKALGAGGSGGDLNYNIKDYNLYQFDATYKF